MGLRRRVSFGFMSIVGVLLLSGLVSFVELNTLSNDTDEILGADRRYKVLSSQMLDALRNHNVAFVQMAAFGDRSLDSLCIASMDRLDFVIADAQTDALVPDVVDSLGVIAAQLREVSTRFLNAPKFDASYAELFEEIPNLDSLAASFSRRRYTEYQPAYDQMLLTIDLYIAESQNALIPSADQLHRNAYRAVTPVLISLSVMIVIVLMLFYFMMTYSVVPVININRSLKDYLAYKVPFAPKGERRDEMQELCERVEQLIKQANIGKNSKE
ncbi:MAG: hypothetical protein R3Y16_02240 [Rikenellaceae bacterium]